MLDTMYIIHISINRKIINTVTQIEKRKGFLQKGNIKERRGREMPILKKVSTTFDDIL